MSMGYIRDYYKVPAKRGGRVTFQGHPGSIASADRQYLMVRLDTGQMVRCHPTWEMTYDDAPVPVVPSDGSGQR